VSSFFVPALGPCGGTPAYIDDCAESRFQFGCTSTATKALAIKSAPRAMGIQAWTEASELRLAGSTTSRAAAATTVTVKKIRNRGTDRFIMAPP